MNSDVIAKKQAELGKIQSILIAILHRLARNVRRVFPAFHICAKLHLKSFKHPVFCRLGTTDYNCLHQVLFQNDYAYPYRFPSAIPGEKTWIIDAGANVGYASLFYAKLYPEKRIMAFEPDPHNYEIAKKNLTPYENVKLHHSALWDTAEPVLIGAKELRNAGEWARQVRKAEGERQERETEVQSMCLQDVLDAVDPSNVAVLKMDIEGSENRVLASVDDQSLARISNCAIEFHGQEEDGLTRDRLSRLGFNAEVRGETNFFTRN